LIREQTKHRMETENKHQIDFPVGNEWKREYRQIKKKESVTAIACICGE